jgi:two-component system cell cycle response regulator
VNSCLHSSFSLENWSNRADTHLVETARAGEEPAGRGALRALIGLVLFGGTLLVIVNDWLGIGGDAVSGFANGPLYDAAIVSAGLACLLKAAGGGRERGAWLAIAAAVLCWGASEIYWTAVLDGDPTPPYPSPADVGYLAFYPLAATGLYLLVRARAEELDWRLWMDGLIAALGTAALGAALIFEFVAARTTGSAIQQATTLAYPLGDVLMLALVVGIVALTRWRPGHTWSLLLVGLAALVVADVAYTLQSTDGSLPGGDWIEPIYLLAAACIGAVAWQPRAETIRSGARFDGWRELVIPALFAAVMIGLFAMQYFSRASGLTTVLWAATMIAVIARLAISVRENKRLLEQVKTDKLTGLGNQGRLQVDLANLCRRAAAEPAALLLLDLNGFKRFNDTFGHPAGDRILAQLGGQLGRAVASYGRAYRVGGDEFAVLASCDVEDCDAIAKRAAEALTASGRGYELGAAWGSVSIPAEATTPEEAMQLADVRMYAQKESRRLAHDDAIAIDGAEVSVLERTRDSEALEQGQ